MSKNDSKLVTKLSPLIENQVPDFVQADHPIFVEFLKHYYQFLEAGKLEIDAESFYIRQETTTTAYILEETDGDRVITESGDGSTGIFINGETITGSTTKATATVLIENVRNGYLFISSQQKFQTGETITGATSGATATITKYRANPVQNIQQLLEYANTDNTIYDFLDQLRNSFMNSIPNTLATGVSKRNLIKNIRDLYAAKGTSEGHKIFMRLFLGETPEIIYPNQYMMRNSDGNWGQEITIRVAPFIGVEGVEAVNQIITGQTSGATAIVVNSFSFQQGTTSVTEFVLQDVVGTFADSEVITATSTTRDVEIKFTVTSILSSTAVVNDGILHSSGEDVTVENIGNGFASVIVDTITSGSVSGVEVDSGGTLYEVGDVVTFTAQSTDTNVEAATGFVSMIGGGIQQETGTLDNSSITTDTIILEDFTNSQLEPFKIELESTQSDKFIADGSTTAFTLTESSTTTDTLTLYLDNVLTPEVNTATGITTWSADGTTVTFTTAPDEDVVIEVYGDSVQYLLVDGHDVNGDGSSIIDVGHQFETEAGLTAEIPDEHTTDTDQIVLEFDTFKNLNASSTESGSIQKVHVGTGGKAYTKLPTASITSTSGTGASLITLTEDIGSIESLKITDSGYNYSVANPPDITPRSHFILKDITGTFASGNLLTSHTGTVKGFDSNTNVLDVDFENVVRVEQEQSGTFNEGIQLEEGTGQQEQSSGILLEDEQDFDDGENIVLDGTGTSTTQPVFKRLYVTMVRNLDDTANVFAIDGVLQPTLRLQEGSTYYFDLSDSSLYNALSTKNHQLRFSETSDGTHNSGSAYTTGVTTSESYIEIGTTGAYIQIVVATGAPDLYYYCVNHSGMGGFAITPPVVTTIDDENDSVLLDGSSNFIQNLLLEDIFENGELRLEASAPGRPSRVLIDQDDTGDGSTPGINQGAFIVLESGNDTTGSSFLQAEDNEGTQSLTHSTVVGGTILLEGSQEEPNATVNNENGKLRIDRYRERETSFLLFDGYQNDAGDIVGAGDVVASEEVGNTLVLDGTDTDASDANDGFLLDDETGDGQILLNASATGNIDDGGHVINEDPIDFSNSNVTITDAGGATATIFKADIATATSTVATTATTAGEYTGIRSLIGEDLNRIQDSYYYQDYSYEVKIGEAFTTYINELKRAVHPAGFQPFGKVSIASEISVVIKDAGSDLAGFSADFSPILGSALETIFDQLILRRIESPKTYEVGSYREQIVYENGIIGGDKLVLDGTSTSVGTTTPADVSIILESSLQPSGYDYDTAYLVLNGTDSTGSDELSKLDLESGSLENEHENILMEDNSVLTLEDGFLKTGDSILFESETRNEPFVGGGRMISESAVNAPSRTAERSFVKEINTQLVTKPTPRITRNKFVYLAKTPFDKRFGGSSAIQLENDTTGVFNTGLLLTDGEIPLNESITKIALEGDEDLNHILLETGGNILTEDGSRILNEDDSSVTRGARDRVLLETGLSDDFLLAEAEFHSFPAGFSVNIEQRILLEDEHDDGTLKLSDVGDVTFADILDQDQFILEMGDIDEARQGILLEDAQDGNIANQRIITESGGIIQLEDIFRENLGLGATEQDNANAVENTGILLENFGLILLDGTDDSSSNSGEHILQETGKLDRFIIERSGSIVAEAFSTRAVVERIITHNDENIILEDIVGELNFSILLEDEGEFDRLVLNGSDVTQGDAGERILMELVSTETTKIITETTNKIVSEGQIPLANITLNSSAKNTKGVTRSAEILVRATGDIALEDETVNDIDGFVGHGMLVLNGTDGSSTNAGDNFDLEGATGITV